MSALLDAALGYAARGIPVYPVHWPRPIPSGVSLGCSCPRGLGCDRPAKHPLVHHGIHDATCDPGQLERWWSRWPHANIGLVTGVVFDALDVDSPAGLAALRRFDRTVGLRFPGPVVHTGGGGWHYWFTPHRARQPSTPRPCPGRLARPRRRRVGPTQPPRQRPALPLAGATRPGATT